VRRCGVSGVAFCVEASGRGRDGVDVENVGSLTPDEGDEVLAIAGFLGVMNEGTDGLEGGCVGDFSRGELMPKVNGGERASKFGLRGGIRACGESGRTCDDNIGGGFVVERAGWMLGVLIVRG
jgi:hypothetical protein